MYLCVYAAIECQICGNSVFVSTSFPTLIAYVRRTYLLILVAKTTLNPAALFAVVAPFLMGSRVWYPGKESCVLLFRGQSS